MGVARGIPADWAGTWAWLGSSGDSTGAPASSRPLEPSAVGDGALRQCCGKGQLIRLMKLVGSGRTWMRFLPSGLVTSGCNLGVVKV